jgi:hypothetical protein
MKLCLSPKGCRRYVMSRVSQPVWHLGGEPRDVRVNPTEAWLSVHILRYPTHTLFKKEKKFHMRFALLLYRMVAGCAATDVHTGVVLNPDQSCVQG